jgi:cytochrome c
VFRARGYFFGAVFAVLLAAATVAIQVLLQNGTAWQRRDQDIALIRSDGNPDRGRMLILQTGCGGCHEISGIPGARGAIGPPLNTVASRLMIGGVIANTPANLMRWIENPRAVNPSTAMPQLGLTPDQSRDIVAFLYANASQTRPN